MGADDARASPSLTRFADLPVPAADDGPIPGWSDPFGTLDPVTASEILRDLTEVTAQ